MKKINIITLFLLLFIAVSVSAQSDKNCTKNNKISTLILEENNFQKDLKIENTTVIVFMKYKTIETTSRKLRVKNIVNFLKNPEKKQQSMIG